MDAACATSSSATDGTTLPQNTLRSIDEQAAIALLHLLEQLDYRFTTVTPTTHALINARADNGQATDLRGIFGWSRPFASAVAGPQVMALMERAGILGQHGQLWRSLARISSLGPHLLLHSAYPTTQADAVFFGPDTYRFVNAINQHLALHAKTIHRAIDIGCGAGPGALTIAVACPSAEILATDINDSALRLTRINAAAARADNIEPVHSNLFDQVDGQFDFIVSNPPYLIDADTRTYRHGGGRLGEGLSIDIVEAALSRLAVGGTLLLYTGVAITEGMDPFIARLKPLLKSSGCRVSYTEVDPDVFAEELSTTAYRKAERIAAVALKVTRPPAHSSPRHS